MIKAGQDHGMLFDDALNEKAMEIFLPIVPSEDPFAFAWGFWRGWLDRSKDTGCEEYYEGYELGQQVRQNKEAMPEWARERKWEP